MAEKIYSVFASNDYDKFKLTDWNRNVSDARVRKLIKSIEEVGQRRVPIVVNKEMEIVDGQTRFMALKKMGKPIHFVIDPDADKKVCVCLNNGQSNWNTQDFIDAYEKQGIEDYVRFNETVRRHASVNWQSLHAIVTDTIATGGKAAQSLRNGELKYTKSMDMEIEPILNFIDKCLPELKRTQGETRVAVTAIGWILKNTSARKDRIEKIIRESWPVLRPVASWKIILEDIEDLYNKGLKESSRVYLVTEYKKKHVTN